MSDVASRLVLGVDPGLDGALCLYDPAVEAICVEDMPTLRLGKKRVIDAYGLARVVDSLASGRAVTAWVEYVASSPQMGVASSFSFGFGAGLLHGVLAANLLTVETVTPPSWKRGLGVKGDKDESRARASALFPRQSALFARAKDHGRADACLVAVHGAREMARRAA